jgi:cyanophycinase
MKILLFFLPLIVSANTLVMIGGGTRPTEAIEAMRVATHKRHPLILILPWGTVDPNGACQTMTEEFLTHGTAGITCLLPTEATEVIEAALTQTHLLYFPGGDQNQIMNHLNTHNLIGLIQKRFKEDLVVGGTSAGTAIQSHPMLTGTNAETSLGLGLSPLIVDQHFLVRNRQERLVQVLKNEKRSGLGIDEGMAVVIDQNQVKVIGPSEVWYYRWPRIDRPIKFKNNQTIYLKAQ